MRLGDMRRGRLRLSAQHLRGVAAAVLHPTDQLVAVPREIARQGRAGFRQAGDDLAAVGGDRFGGGLRGGFELDDDAQALAADGLGDARSWFRRGCGRYRRDGGRVPRRRTLRARAPFRRPARPRRSAAPRRPPRNPRWRARRPRPRRPGARRRRRWRARWRSRIGRWIRKARCWPTGQSRRPCGQAARQSIPAPAPALRELQPARRAPSHSWPPAPRAGRRVRRSARADCAGFRRTSARGRRPACGPSISSSLARA